MRPVPFIGGARASKVMALRAAACALLGIALACSSRPGPATRPAAAADDAVRVTIVQLNDLYEITPMAGGRWGGAARVATLIQRLRDENPNTISVLAGDLLSPSALGTAVVDGERLDGRQMVDVLNAMGLDWATFGNHEFDLREAAFRARLAESRFRWISSNVSDTAGNAFPGVARHAMTTASSDAGTVRVGWIGLTMNPEQTPFARFADPIETARTQAAVLHDSVDVLIALTHLTLAQDIALAESVPPIFMILGGHDHENLQLRRGEDLTPILKADANVRTVWVHELRWYPRTRSLAVDSRLVPITDSLPDDPETAAAAAHWVDAAFAAFRAAGFEPAEVVAHVPVELDGLESVVRNRSTALTQLIVDAMRAEVAGAHAALVNSGSIRIDDVLAPGPLTQYDVIRILPFGGPVVEVEMSGALLARVLDQGLLNRGSGGFLQLSNIERVQSSWHVAGTPLDARQSYRIGLSDFLLTGRERGLAFLHRDNPELTVVREHRDVRLAFIAEVRRRWQ